MNTNEGMALLMRKKSFLSRAQRVRAKELERRLDARLPPFTQKDLDRYWDEQIDWSCVAELLAADAGGDDGALQGGAPQKT